MGGCPPKEWMMEKPFLIDQERCTGCGICVRECPTNAITLALDTTKPADARPKPVIIRRQRLVDDGYWHPLSEYTTEYLKRPVTGPWSGIGEWKPMTTTRDVSQVWRGMREPKGIERPKSIERPKRKEKVVEPASEGVSPS